VLDNTRVGRIRISGGRATGVECDGPAGQIFLAADRVVLSAGAIGSAQLLMLSGIGPAAALTSAGVPVLVDLPVGTRSADHPEWVLPVDWPAAPGRPPLEAVLTTGDGLEISRTDGFAR
jgi:choline dehydrogenase-like flavoprotein